MIRAPINGFGLLSVSGTVFATDTVTPAQNAYGSYAALLDGSEVTDDSYGIWINFSGGAVSGAARDILARIGLDPAGGTSYTAFISDLVASCCGTLSASNGGCGGISYFFPVIIKAGTSIGCGGSVNNATVGTFSCTIQLMQKPTGPEIPRYGSKVIAFGSAPSTSNGTAVTPNSASSKSAYVQLGSSIGADDVLWYWCLGVCCNNASMSNTSSMWDLAVGDASNKKLVIFDQLVMPGAVETMAFTSRGAVWQAKPGDNVYVRAGSNGVSPTGMSAIGYGVGG